MAGESQQYAENSSGEKGDVEADEDGVGGGDQVSRWGDFKHIYIEDYYDNQSSELGHNFKENIFEVFLSFSFSGRYSRFTSVSDLDEQRQNFPLPIPRNLP